MGFSLRAPFIAEIIGRRRKKGLRMCAILCMSLSKDCRSIEEEDRKAREEISDCIREGT
jgi:hypothetical protein